ncbi:MAG: aminotransferase class I/II-fold pyridoxal phosphate-dependent enzyme, partial [Planctomycetota bacterium]
MAELKPIPLTIPDLRGNEAKYLEQCVRDNWISSAGPFVVEMERRVASLSGRAHAVATVNGTTAIELALRGLGVGVGDLVAVPDWTFAATANAVIHAGAVPLFIDVTNATWTFDPSLLSSALNRYGRRIKAVVPVHALGHPADIDSILQACGENL